jgi:hypothetical protein
MIAWAIGGTIGGVLMILELGAVGVWAGIAVLVWGIVRAVQLALTIIYPPGTIKVTASEVVLPRGVHRPHPLKVPPKDVTAVYFLRRSVPWNRSSPVLVVELGERAMAFPRDWFASEADQRHVIHALLGLRPRDGQPGATKPAEAKAAETSPGDAKAADAKPAPATES